MLAVFIDGGYIDKVLQEEFDGCRVDYGLLARLLAGDTEVLRTYYYSSPPHLSHPASEEERARQAGSDSFFRALSRLPRFEVRLGKCERRYDVNGEVYYEQKRVDVLMAVDMVLLATKHRIERAVLLTGDSDLIPAIEVVRNEGVLVHLYHGGRPHNELWNASDDRTQLTTDMIEQVRMT